MFNAEHKPRGTQMGDDNWRRLNQVLAIAVFFLRPSFSSRRQGDHFPGRQQCAGVRDL